VVFAGLEPWLEFFCFFWKGLFRLALLGSGPGAFVGFAGLLTILSVDGLMISFILSSLPSLILFISSLKSSMTIPLYSCTSRRFEIFLYGTKGFKISLETSADGMMLLLLYLYFSISIIILIWRFIIIYFGTHLHLNFGLFFAWP
jgi:hypothetical protein